MAGLIDMIANNPAIIQTIARQANIDTGSAGSIIGKLAPILMGGVKSNLQSDKDSSNLIRHIKSNDYAKIFDAPQEALSNDNYKDIGNNLLAELTGSKENSRAVAQHVEQKTGLSSSIIKNILPMLAPFVIGALTKSSSSAIGTNHTSSSGLTSMLTNFIDQDNDGSIIDDVMRMASGFLFR